MNIIEYAKFKKMFGGGGSADDSIVGTWQFKEVPNLEGQDAVYMVHFKVNSPEYGGIITCHGFYIDPSCTEYQTDEDGYCGYDIYSGWQYEEYKVITILEEPTDEAFITWLKANAIKQGGTMPSTTPSAYTVSSVDELPENAVDGSLAIVENAGMVGVYELKQYFSEEDFPVGFDEYYNFKFYTVYSEEENHKKIIYDSMRVFNPVATVLISYYEGDTAMMDGVYDDGWGGYIPFLINIIEEPTDEKVRNFINTFATKYPNGNYIFAKENGSWVYKCEVT